MIDQVEQVREILRKAADTHCELCGAVITCGLFAFELILPGNQTHLACWHCGEALRLHLGYPVTEALPNPF